MEHGPPLPCSFLSKHKDGQRRTRTYTSSGTAATSGGAHPTCGQTFPGEHQRNLQRGFKQPANANTNTHACIYARTQRTAEVKGWIRWSEGGTKSSTLKVLQHLRSTLPAAGVDFHHRWSFVHTSLCVSPARQGSSEPPGGEQSCVAGQRF